MPRWETDSRAALRLTSRLLAGRADSTTALRAE